MGLEIERKFLVVSDAWRVGAVGIEFRQGYLSTHKERTVRVRLEGEQGKLTIKGLTRGASRRELEYVIPPADANTMLDELCEQPLIEKTRYRVPTGDVVWEIDEFRGANAGLVVAEVELRSEDQQLVLPPWVGHEVTGDRRYFNSNLVARPYSTW